MANYYQPEIERASREQIKAWQDERLVDTVRHVYANVPYYKRLMDEKGVTPGDIKSRDDLYKLPFLTKNDLREAYPYGLLAAPLDDCVRIQSTSGTTGKRVVAFYTQAVDLFVCEIIGHQIDTAPARLWPPAVRKAMLCRSLTAMACLQAARGSTEVRTRSAA